MPLGQYLLCDTFHMLHEIVHQLLSGNPISHGRGPWSFLPAWLSLYTANIIDFPNLVGDEFPFQFWWRRWSHFQTLYLLGWSHSLFSKRESWLMSPRGDGVNRRSWKFNKLVVELKLQKSEYRVFAVLIPLQTRLYCLDREFLNKPSTGPPRHFN
jgi:hypothetical protein